MSDNITIGGKTLATDDIAAGVAAGSMVVRDKIGFGSDGTYGDVEPANPLPVREPGTYAYAAGTGPANVDLPEQARLRRISVVAGGGAVTITIGGGTVITVPAGMAFDEVIPGTALGADVVIGGTVQAFYVSWVA